MTRATYDFTLETCGRSLLDDDVFDALCEAGCDDALAGRVDGVDCLDFTREANSYGEALRTAITDVRTVAGLGIARVAVGRDNTREAVYTAAVNAMLASLRGGSASSGESEQQELMHLWEQTAERPSE